MSTVGCDPHHDVSVPVEKLDELLEAPQTALHAAQNETGNSVLRSCKHKKLMSGHLKNVITECINK